MDIVQQLIIKNFLTILDAVPAGLPPDAVFAQVERMMGAALTQGERDEDMAVLKKKEWVYEYRNRLTDRVTYAITEAGRVAMQGL